MLTTLASAMLSALDTRCSAEVRGRRFESLPLREIESGILPTESQSISGPEGEVEHSGRVCFEGPGNVAYGLGEVMRWHRPTLFVIMYSFTL